MATVKNGRRTAPTDVNQLVKVAWWYYFDGLTQDQIGEKLGVSRASVARMIDRSRLEGIVQFRLAPKYLSRVNVAETVRSAYGLRDVVITPEPVEQISSKLDEQLRLGTVASSVLLEHLEEGSTLAVGWGEAVSTVMSILDDDELGNVDLVSLTGGVNSYMSALQQVRSRGGRATSSDLVPTPLYVSTDSLATQLREEQSVQETLDRARSADVALMGIGGISLSSSLWRWGIAGKEELDVIKASGAVGDILAVFYDTNGDVVPLPWDGRRIGVDIQALRDIPTVIAMAAGEEKYEAILGALRGGYCDILITDLATATFLEQAIERE